MAYDLTADDVATLTGDGLTTWDDPLLALPDRRTRQGSPGSPVLMHLLDLVLCSDGVEREVVTSSILITVPAADTPGARAEDAADDAFLAEQVALSLTRDLAATGLYAYPDPVRGNAGDGTRVSQYVETCVVRDGLEHHVPPGSTWTDVLTAAVERFTDLVAEPE